MTDLVGYDDAVRIVVPALCILVTELYASSRNPVSGGCGATAQVLLVEGDAQEALGAGGLDAAVIFAEAWDSY